MMRLLRFCGYSPRRRSYCSLLLVIFVLSVLLMSCLTHYYMSSHVKFPKERQLEEVIAGIQARIEFLESLYRARQEDILILQEKILSRRSNHTSIHHSIFKNKHHLRKIPLHLSGLLKNLTGTIKRLGVDPKDAKPVMSSFAYNLMPHLMDHPSSLKPAFLIKGTRDHCDVVIGIPTVKRDKQSYIALTLNNLMNAMSEEEKNRTLIVVYIGETDTKFVYDLAEELVSQFLEYVHAGLLEIVAPSPYYYPDLNAVSLSLGDSNKRVMWRTKQNLDMVYLMAYARFRGTYYLMLEDDVTAKDRFMKKIMDFTKATTVTNPNWFILEFCNIGGIGKLFRASNLIHFMTYVQLFYKNMPIDWLLESYVADTVCAIDKGSNIKYDDEPLFFPHDNPKVKYLHTDIPIYEDHTLSDVYEGKNFFWGLKPLNGNVVEFWFRKPTNIVRYTIRSGNIMHQNDKFYDAVLEVLPIRQKNFTFVDTFDEFGFASGTLKFGRLIAMRIRVTKDSSFWIIISEIELISLSQSNAGRPRYEKPELPKLLQDVGNEPEYN